jgi:hypothetical protein
MRYIETKFKKFYIEKVWQKQYESQSHRIQQMESS